MNIVMLAKIECCLELCTNADEFKEMVLKVTAMSPARFDELSVTSYAYVKLSAGVPAKQILQELF